MRRAPRLSDILARDANLFNAVRLVAAAAVIVSHAVAIRHGLVPEPLDGPTPYALSDHAVNVFFALSGLLVAMSFERSATIADFVRARLLRIFPAVLVCALVTAFLFGPLLTSESLADYARDARTWLYPLRLGLWLDEDAPLPGLFETVPLAGEVNQPIWTLRWELAAYAGVALLGLAGLLRRKGVILIVLGLTLAAFLAEQVLREATDNPDAIDNALRYGFLYVLGAAAYAWRRELPLSWLALAALAGVTALATGTPFESPLWLGTVAYGALVVGALPLPALRRLTERSDLSYGLYIYGWPITQALQEALPDISFAMLCMLALIGAGICAALSWFWIEKPALAFKARRASPPQ